MKLIEPSKLTFSTFEFDHKGYKISLNLNEFPELENNLIGRHNFSNIVIESDEPLALNSKFDHQFDNHLYEGILPLIRTNNSYVCAIDCYKVLQN